MPHPEYQYLNTLRDIVDNGTRNENRTGVDTLRLLGVQHRYDFKDGFPLFTTKKTWFKGVAIELLWFLSGSSNIGFMVRNGVNIWNDDAYRVYCKTIKEKNEWLERIDATPNVMALSKEKFVEEIKGGNEKLGEIGPVYGVQWRRWQVEKDGGYMEYDQIANLISELKNNPASRRHILSAWNAGEITKMGLPPCHVMSQFTVQDNKLWCHMYQRSCDMFLGVPFNVASYSLLTYMLASICGYEPGGFIHALHDCHIYTNHLDGVTELLARTPRAFPTLRLSEGVETIDEFQYLDFAIEGYDPYPAIKAQLNVG